MPLFFSKSGVILMQKSFLWDEKPAMIQSMGNISEISLFSGREDAYMTMPEYIAHTHEDGAVQRVDEHLRGTARLAAQFAADFDAEALGAVCGLLHDIGK